jgi:antitoxin (DNA-binding transcriptional repressor) of toxin-antitoxin stability system
MSENWLELNGIERMYADDLFGATARAERGLATVITRDGRPVAFIQPLAEPESREYVDSYDRSAPTPEVGSRWIWERGNEIAQETITVTEVKWNGEEWWVKSAVDKRPRRRLNSTEPDTPYWNDLGRFWEAVSPFAAAPTQL